MAGLLDYIFSTLDIENLEQKKVIEYLCYLQEKTSQIYTIEEKLKFVDYRVRLTKRLIALDRTALRNLDNVLTEYRKTIASNKVKHHLV